MDRNATNNRQWLAVLGTQARELTDAELDCVSGGDTQAAAPTPILHSPLRVVKVIDKATVG